MSEVTSSFSPHLKHPSFQITYAYYTLIYYKFVLLNCVTKTYLIIVTVHEVEKGDTVECILDLLLQIVPQFIDHKLHRALLDILLLRRRNERSVDRAENLADRIVLRLLGQMITSVVAAGTDNKSCLLQNT